MFLPCLTILLSFFLASFTSDMHRDSLCAESYTALIILHWIPPEILGTIMLLWDMPIWLNVNFSSLVPGQLGKLQGAELKTAKLKFALSGRSLAHIRASLQAVAKMAVVDYLRNLMHAKHQNKVQNTSIHATGYK